MSKNEHEKTRSCAAVVPQLCREPARASLQDKIMKMAKNTQMGIGNVASCAAVVSQLCRELARAVLQNKIAKMTSNIDNHHKQQINVKKMHDVLTCAPYTQERRKNNETAPTPQIHEPPNSQ